MTDDYFSRFKKGQDTYFWHTFRYIFLTKRGTFTTMRGWPFLTDVRTCVQCRSAEYPLFPTRMQIVIIIVIIAVPDTSARRMTIVSFVHTYKAKVSLSYNNFNFKLAYTHDRWVHQSAYRVYDNASSDMTSLLKPCRNNFATDNDRSWNFLCS